MRLVIKRAWLGMLCMTALALVGAPSAAQAAFDDPLFVFKPVPLPNDKPPFRPPPVGSFEGPCGLAVDNAGNVYVSDYYHHAIDVFTSAMGGGGYITQIAEEDPLDGPCGLALDAAGSIYVNNFHRNVVKFGPQPVFVPGPVIAGVGRLPEPPAGPTHPSGVAVDRASGKVYVDERTQVTVFNSAGVPLEVVGSFGDGYGIAVSEYGATAGLVYVADAATNTVLAYDPATPLAPPAVIDGTGTPAGHFTSLRNSAVAVDRVSGEVYVVDDLTPEYTGHHEGVVYVFSPTGTYKGRLKFSVDNALPAGLAVDNSGGPTQGRVYVTSGNSEIASVYAYPPGAATSAAVPLPKPPPAAGTPDPEPGGSGLAIGGGAASTAAVAVAGVSGEVASQQATTVAPAAATRPRDRARRRKAAAKRKAAKHKRQAAARRHRSAKGHR